MSNVTRNRVATTLTSHKNQNLAEIESELELFRFYTEAAKTDNTRKAYKNGIRQFIKWGGYLPADSNTVIRYLLAKARVLNPSTLSLHLTAISQWHRFQNLENPVVDPMVQETFRGICKTHGKPKKKAKALHIEYIVQLINYIDSLPESNKKYRDRAIILTSFFGAFRRSELVSIEIDYLNFEREGLIIELPKSKTDQEGEGKKRVLPYDDPLICPGAAIKYWLEVSGITHGPVFRSMNRWDTIKDKALNPGGVNDLLKSLGKACGIEFTDELSSHSFRRGMSTSAARENVDFQLIKKQGGWKSDSVVRDYIEEGQQFTENASKSIMKKMKEIMKSE